MLANKANDVLGSVREKVLTTDEGSDPVPQFSPCEVTSEVLGLVLDSPVQEIHGHTGSSPTKGHKDDSNISSTRKSQER